jgi:hypothetical protein
MWIRLGLPLPLLLLSLSTASAQSIIYEQDWESGIGGWFSKHGPTDPVTLVQDPSAPSPPTVQQITRQDGAGNYFSPRLALEGGHSYCVASWIRWVGGGWPFVGFDTFDAGGVPLGENWLIGQAGTLTGYNSSDTVTPVPSDTTDWQWYGKTIALRPDAASVRIKNELWLNDAKPGDNLGFFDDVAIYDGRCPSEPPPRKVVIDIRPSSPRNSINVHPDRLGVIPVAILTTDFFDATTVDPSTVLFGATGTEAAPVHYSLADVDGDGRTDLIFQFRTQDTGIQCGAVTAHLTATTFGGQAIQGSDSIITVGC